MTTSEVNAILVELAEIKGELRQLRKENDNADRLHEKFDVRIGVLERTRWMLAGFFLAGSGAGAAAAKLIGV